MPFTDLTTQRLQAGLVNTTVLPSPPTAAAPLFHSTLPLFKMAALPDKKYSVPSRVRGRLLVLPQAAGPTKVETLSVHITTYGVHTVQ